VDATAGRDIAFALLVFVVPLQLVTAVVALGARDVGVATGMAVLAGTWAVVAAVRLGHPPGATSDALALLFGLAAVCLLVPAIVAAGGKGIAAAVIGASAVRFGLSAAAEASGSDGWATVAGCWGVGLGLLALYAALALALEDAREDTVLPTLRPAPVDDEAGVRDQL
jgi:hypothetical protein